ncbi:hypothetical protein ACH5RR_025243 [Cinchona calisaya]|uniref:Legume lectin domain-containing protein n=1 Tax=Cinchona calisaya TaxID=153742 RepID=A0ABD2YZ36_9GENT
MLSSIIYDTEAATKISQGILKCRFCPSSNFIMAVNKFLLIMLIEVLFFFFCVSPIEFDLPSIGPEDVNRFINITGDAYISKQGIQVTPNERNMALGGKTGRATYIQPLHLWDKSSGDPFVALEFDTFSNPWDPPGQHVGIDINSIQSVANVTWRNNVTNGNISGITCLSG